MNNIETEIFNTALTKLSEIMDVEISTHHLDHTELIDTKVQFQFKQNSAVFNVEIKSEARTAELHQLLMLKKGLIENLLLISKYIPTPLKEQLKTEKINYIETSGNCFIQSDGIFLFINDRQIKEGRNLTTGRLWKTAGLKFIFAILCEPDLLNQPYRTIAQKANMGLGTIGPLMKDLMTQGFLKGSKSNNQTFLFLEQKDQLIQKWVEVYTAVLKPKLYMGNFRFMRIDNELSWKSISSKYFKWGGENAGALLTNYLRPEKYTMYTNTIKTTLMKDIQLIPDIKGEIEVYEQFWSKDLIVESENEITVPPFLAYAELITSLDSRNRETAERIKEKYLG